jgi:hypothetical protein
MSITTTNSATTTTPKLSPSSSSLLSALKRDGYVLIPSLLPTHYINTLRTHCSTLTSLARSGTWPHVRTVPKQFPPWPSTPPPASSGGIWGVQHLLHPSNPSRREFANLYFSDAVLEPVKELLELESAEEGDEGLVMELFNLLVSPTGGVPFELRWHRDDLDISRPELSDQEEGRLIENAAPGGRQLHAQYNIALYPDNSLIVVPGSHRRPRTGDEKRVEPYNPDMPGAVVVKLKPGDAVFYDSNILHRGVYEGVEGDGGDVEVQRYTLHGSVGLKNKDVEGGGEGKARKRARVVLQHGVGEWADTKGFEGFFNGVEGEKRVERRAEMMRRALVEMGRGEGVGFSLEG